jgi:hypothetical protein
MPSLHDNHFFKLAKLTKGKITLKNKGVYWVKQDENTSRPWYIKLDLFLKDSIKKKKKKRVDFYEIFSPIINMSSIIMVLG